MTKTVVVLLSSVMLASAQTNFYPLLECHNRNYTNATVDPATPAAVTVSWGGSAERVSMTNLPDVVQKQFGYDPAAAEKYLSDQAAKKIARLAAVQKNAVEAAKAAATLGDPKRVRLVKSIGSSQVQIISDGVYQTAYIHNLPFEIMSFLEDYNNTVDHVHDVHNVSGAETVVQRNGVRTASAYAADATTARQHLADLAPSRVVLERRLTVIARPSQFYISPGVRQWEFIAIPSE